MPEIEYQLEINRSNAVSLYQLLLALRGPSPAHSFQRRVLQCLIGDALGIDHDRQPPVEQMPERITVKTTKRQLDAVWFGILELAQMPTCTGADWVALERAAKVTRLHGRWVSHFSGLSFEPCDLAFDNEEIIDNDTNSPL